MLAGLAWEVGPKLASHLVEELTSQRPAGWLPCQGQCHLEHHGYQSDLLLLLGFVLYIVYLCVQAPMEVKRGCWGYRQLDIRHGCWEPDSRPLKELQVLLSAEPCIQLWFCF